MRSSGPKTRTLWVLCVVLVVEAAYLLGAAYVITRYASFSMDPEPVARERFPVMELGLAGGGVVSAWGAAMVGRAASRRRPLGAWTCGVVGATNAVLGLCFLSFTVDGVSTVGDQLWFGATAAVFLGASAICLRAWTDRRRVADSASGGSVALASSPPTR